jgi:anti-sigma regulatory factor (Ser/Thr protein kinase)
MAAHLGPTRGTEMTAPAHEHVGGGLVHAAMPYRDEGEYLAGIVSVVRSAWAADQRVLVEVPAPRGELVRDALGTDAAQVEFGDMTEDGRNPGRIIPVLFQFGAAHPGRHLAMISEPMWPARSAHAYTAVVQHEALVNLAFAGQHATVVCPYNVSELPEQALVDAERTHPTMLVDGERVASTRYTDPGVIVEEVYEQLPTPPPDAEVFDFTVVAKARQVVFDWATRTGLPAGRVTDLLIAVSEIGGNSIIHGRAGATLLTWTEDDWLICEIRDKGHITDPLAGRVPPPIMAEAGRGLLMVNYLCDLVQLRTGPTGTAIRLWMNLPED